MFGKREKKEKEDAQETRTQAEDTPAGAIGFSSAPCIVEVATVRDQCFNRWERRIGLRTWRGLLAIAGAAVSGVSQNASAAPKPSPASISAVGQTPLASHAPSSGA